MYCNSLGDAANLQNHEIQTRKKVHVTRVGIHAAFGGWSGGGGGGTLARWLLGTSEKEMEECQ